MIPVGSHLRVGLHSMACIMPLPTNVTVFAFDDMPFNDSEENFTWPDSVENFTWPRAVTAYQTVYQETRHVVYNLVIPVVCLLGMAGNLFNLIVFIRRTCMPGTHELEKASLTGLMALAMSDLFFCLVGFPTLFLYKYTSFNSNSSLELAGFYYNRVYHGPLLNFSILSSTWCIVLISMARYIAVCHPFKARWFIRWWKTLLTHLIATICSVLFTLPEFLRYTVYVEPECAPGCMCSYLKPRPFLLSGSVFKLTYSILWALLGTLLPLGLLIYFNVRLVLEIYRSKTQGLTDPDRYSASRLTLTVVCIVTSFLVLVCPSMILDVIKPLLREAGNSTFFHASFAMVILNLLQAIKFSSNFLLYFAVNKQFRDACRCSGLRGGGSTWSRTSSDNKVDMTLVKL